MSTLDEAPVCAATGRGTLLPNFGLPNFGFATTMNRVAAMVSAWRGRKTVMDMRDFSDAQLADIGLERRDVDAALDLPLSVDPSLYLSSARQNPLRGTRRF